MCSICKGNTVGALSCAYLIGEEAPGLSGASGRLLESPQDAGIGRRFPED